MSGLPVVEEGPAPRRAGPSAAHKRRLLVRRVILSGLILALTMWLIGAAQAESSGPVERILLRVLAALLPIHLFFWQLEGIRLIDRARKLAKPLAIAVAYLALASSPMVLYPLGLLAVVVSLFGGGGAAAPALAVTGTLMLSPIIAIILIALMFMTSRHGR
ncbi:MAG: hypothetical protein ACJ8EY_11590 [Sphingomicrobium sp.]